MQQYCCLFITFSGTVHPEFNLQGGGLNFFSLHHLFSCIKTRLQRKDDNISAVLTFALRVFQIEKQESN